MVAALTAATTEKTKHLSASRDGNRDWMREAASQGMSLPATTEDASMKHTSLSSFMFILLQARPTGTRPSYARAVQAYVRHGSGASERAPANDTLHLMKAQHSLGGAIGITPGREQLTAPQLLSSSAGARSFRRCILFPDSTCHAQPVSGARRCCTAHGHGERAGALRAGAGVGARPQAGQGRPARLLPRRRRAHHHVCIRCATAGAICGDGAELPARCFVP